VVKLRFRVIKRVYKNKTYFNEDYNVSFPKDIHKLLRFLRNKNVTIAGRREEETLYITMTEDKTP